MLGFAVGVLLLMTIAGELGRYYWLFDLFVHFKLQYAVAFAACSIAAVWTRASPLAIICIALCVFHLAPVLGFAYQCPELPANNPTSTSAVRIVSYNAGFWNDNYREIGAFLESTRADAVILLEYDNARLDRLSRYLPSYRFRSSSLANQPFGAAILSRWPMVRAASTRLAADEAVAVYAQIETNRQIVNVFGVHVSWPATPHSSQLREGELQRLTALLADCKAACVVAGDFNLTQWSTHFAALQTRLGWNNCARGQGLAFTWPDQIPPLRIQIDQCLADPAVHVTRFATGPGMGSDHLPLIVDLAVEGRVSD